MRAIPEAPAAPERHDRGPVPSNDAAPAGFAKNAIRNSPWLVIAITVHVVAIAVMSVINVTRDARKEVETGFTGKVRQADVDEPEPPPLEPPKPDDRPPVPSSETHEGPDTTLEVVDLGALPGDPGPPGSGPMTDHPGDPNPDGPPDLPPGASGAGAIGVGPLPVFRGTGRPCAFPGRGGGGFSTGGDGKNGHRGIRTDGPIQKTEDALWSALKWLKHHQSPDGRWDCDGFDAMCKLNRCDGAGDASHDAGVTGLATLAFLGAGYTQQTESPFRQTVSSAVRWLRDVQDAEGCVGQRTSHSYIYDHACGALALVEAYGMTGNRALKEPAIRGVAFAMKAKNPYSAWRYDVPAAGDNDTSVTGWMVMLLKSARMSGIDIDEAAMRDAASFVDKMTEPEFGRVGYHLRGEGPARTEGNKDRFPAGKSESMTAVGLCVRVFAGHRPESDPMIGKAADLLLKNLPKWDADAGTNDFYYWYYASLGMFQVGGEKWKRWNDAMKTAILGHQRLEKGRDECGSWDPVDAWSVEGGRIYSTAINALTMEVYYRYPSAFGVKQDGREVK